MSRLAASVLALALVILTANPAGATPDRELDDARAAFRRGDYAAAIPMLNLLLYPDAKLSSTEDLVEAHVLLGVAHFETGNREAAARELEEALFLDPDITLDRLQFSEKAVAFFRETRARLREKAQQDAQVRALAEERDRLRTALANLVVIEKRPFYVNLLPLGAGQFQNGHTRKGVAFFTSQVAFGGASLGIFVYHWQRYGFGGTVPTEEVEDVQLLQSIQVATGSIALGLIAWGIVDALVYYEPTRQVQADRSLLPEEFELSPEPEPADTSFRLVPVPLPGGAGAALSLEF